VSYYFTCRQLTFRGKQESRLTSIQKVIEVKPLPGRVGVKNCRLKSTPSENWVLKTSREVSLKPSSCARCPCRKPRRLTAQDSSLSACLLNQPTKPQVVPVPKIPTRNRRRGLFLLLKRTKDTFSILKLKFCLLLPLFFTCESDTYNVN